MKIVYQHNETKEIIEDELPANMSWLDKQFYYKYVHLGTDEISFYDSDWRLIRYIPTNVLVFEFNTDEYVW